MRISALSRWSRFRGTWSSCDASRQFGGPPVRVWLRRECLRLRPGIPLAVQSSQSVLVDAFASYRLFGCYCGYKHFRVTFLSVKQPSNARPTAPNPALQVNAPKDFTGRIRVRVIKRKGTLDTPPVPPTRMYQSFGRDTRRQGDLSSHARAYLSRNSACECSIFAYFGHPAMVFHF